MTAPMTHGPQEPPGAAWQAGGLCGGCRDLGACRIGLRKWVTAEGDVRGEITFRPEHMGGPGVIHGGWTALVFDEMCGLVCLAEQVWPAVTVSLTVDYLRPVPVGSPVALEAAATAREGRDLHVAASMRLAGGTAVLARATARFRLVGHEHFARHAAWPQSQPPPA